MQRSRGMQIPRLLCIGVGLLELMFIVSLINISCSRIEHGCSLIPVPTHSAGTTSLFHQKRVQRLFEISNNNYKTQQQ
jgi:hypothetical protein